MTSFIVLGGAPAQEAEIAMAVRDEGTHSERVGQVSCSHQHLLVGGESSQDSKGDGLIGRSPVFHGEGHRPLRGGLGVGLASRVPVELREGGEPRREVRPLLYAFAVGRTLLQERDPFGHTPEQAEGMPETHGDDADPVMDVVLARGLEARLEDLDGLLGVAHCQVNATLS